MSIRTWLATAGRERRPGSEAHRGRLPAKELPAAQCGWGRECHFQIEYATRRFPSCSPANPLTRPIYSLTVRAGTLRHHAGQAAFPGAVEAGDSGPVSTALREARGETGLDPSRLHPLATMERMFILPSGFHVVPVLSTPGPGPVAVGIPPRPRDGGARSAAGVHQSGQSDHGLSGGLSCRYAGLAFLPSTTCWWGFTGHVISAMPMSPGGSNRGTPGRT